MPKHTRTYTLSAGDHRESLGEYVPGRVHVPVVAAATVRAFPLAIGEGKDMAGRAARAACLGGRKPSVHLDQRAAVPDGFVGEHPHQFSPCGIADGPRMPLGLHHAFDGEVFDDDHLVFVDQPPGELVQVILPRIAHGGTGAGHLNAGLGAVLRSFRLAGKSPLQSSKSLLTCRQMAGILDLLPGGERSQRRQAEVDPDRIAAGQFLGRHQHAAGDEPAVVRLANHRDGGGLRRQWARPDDIQRLGHLRQFQYAVAVVEAALGKLGGLPAVFAAKARIACRLAEEVAIGAVKMAERLLQRHAGHVVQPRQRGVFFPLRQQRAGFDEAALLFAASPGFFAGGAGAVVHDAHTSKRPVQQAGLFRGGVEPETKSGFGDHFCFYVGLLSRIVNTATNRRARLIPGMNAWVSAARPR